MTEENGLSVVNGVQVIQDGDVTHFVPVKDETEKRPEEKDNRTWFGKLMDWLKNGKVTPYVKIRDMADPFGDRTDPDAGSDGRSGIEAGIKIRF